ncbi:terminase large subunit [Frankia sp. Mgl5]|uniref:terminase large subunit n=1 Tax=Frankia sp. Mgl5 TaxID=2933793 RepID=UPI00200D40E9|nr:terminase TerL endonuclease subunit [Frankia sp. Mgl5]MCK9928793.1 terminase large subunit [Frankia sp. Mgl5]
MTTRRTTTRSRSGSPAEPTAAELRRLKISPEVAWYMTERGIPLPEPWQAPRYKTPEPRRLRGARFDPDRVDRVLAAFGRLKHTQGEWAGRALRPDPWQVAYVLAPVYGWVRKNSRGVWVRVARTCYVDIPRKNGKTTLAGGQALYLTGGDGEAGAQVYAAAASRDQAGYCFAPVKALTEGSPGLRRHFRPLAARITHPRSGSYFAVVSSMADLLHGANVHAAVIDELHIHKTRDLVDALETGTGARAQPLIVIITTADDSRRDTIYAEKRDYAEQLARGGLEDPSFYAVVWAADRKADPFAEETWRSANPGYGISPTKEFLEAESTKARQSPANLSRFLRLHLGVRTKQEVKYLELEVWDANAGMVDAAALAGAPAYGGLDLAATSDLCSLCWLFPCEDGTYDALWRHWLPEERLPVLDKRTAGQASTWVREGWLTLTPGSVVDYAYIRQAIVADAETYDAVQIGYDPWNATSLVTDLVEDDGIDMVPVRQGFASMSAPTKELARLLGRGTAETPVVRHGGNPLMRWQIDCFAVELDPAENVKPSKKKASDKIDGVVALVDALAVEMVHRDDRSVYESGELEVG